MHEVVYLKAYQDNVIIFIINKMKGLFQAL
jgi:hypothetical protein